MVFTEIISQKQYNNIIEKKKIYIIVLYFYTIWCQTCIKQEYILDNYFNNNNNNNILFYKIDAEKVKDLISYLDITTVPLIYIYKNGIKDSECYGTYNNLIEILKSKILV